MCDDQELKRAAKEHAAAVQHYIDAGRAVSASLGRIAALIANASGDDEFYTLSYYRAKRATALVDQAAHAIRHALEPQ